LETQARLFVFLPLLPLLSPCSSLFFSRSITYSCPPSYIVFTFLRLVPLSILSIKHLPAFYLYIIIFLNYNDLSFSPFLYPFIQYVYLHLPFLFLVLFVFLPWPLVSLCSSFKISRFITFSCSAFFSLVPTPSLLQLFLPPNPFLSITTIYSFSPFLCPVISSSYP
jgi:hypothetical protein